MNPHELKMVDLVLDLKENYHVTGLKAEVESMKPDEILRLKKMTDLAGLNFTIKIGGSEAMQDLYNAKEIGANAVVAPMIESPYAAKKYIQAVKTVFKQDCGKSVKVLICIETKYGFKYLDEILSADFADNLTGVVMGRGDLTESLDMQRIDVNNETILEYAKSIAERTLRYGKELIIGGGITPLSLSFFKKLPKGALSGFETRKVIFDAKTSLLDKNADLGILKAIEFELMWIKNKQNYSNLTNEDINRIEILDMRLKKSATELEIKA